MMEPLNAIGWIDCRAEKPPKPATPYEVYLVWVIQLHHDATGTSCLWQFSRDRNDWMALPNGPTGAAQIVTHYSQVLQKLGSPPPQPDGPRGHHYL